MSNKQGFITLLFNECVMRISTDNGKTFDPLLKLATNDTIGSGQGGG